MSGRHLDDFITKYLEYTKDTESPTQYHLWSAITAIGATLQRRVYMRWGVETIYPNLYTILIGPSGKCRKGVALGIITDLFREIGLPYTAEKITKEKLIRRFKDSIATFEDPQSGIEYHCSLVTFSEELHVFLGNQDVDMLAALTDFYNCKPEWTYDTKNQGTDKIQNICYSILGATAPDWLVSILPQEGLGGGFTARVIFVVEEEKRDWIAHPLIPPTELKSILVKDLQQISLITGEYKFSPEALEIYKHFYLSQRDGKAGVKDPKFASYNERRATHIKKLAMIMTASRTSSKRIEAQDISRAIVALEAVEVKMPRVFRTLGKSRYSELTMLVFDYMVKQHRTTQSEILRKFYLDVDDYTLDIITKTLWKMRAISIDTNPKTGDTIYTVVDNSGANS